MVEKNSAQAGCTQCPGKETACIHTKRIMDSCLDKDCIEDLRVYLTKASQQALERCTGVKVRSVELLHVYIDVEPAPYKRGCYSLDLTFFYRVLSDAMLCGTRPETLCGLAVFSKRVILYGGTGCAKVFTSQTRLRELDKETLLSEDVPQAVVEVLDPMVLSAKVVELCDCCRCEPSTGDIPGCIASCFDSELVFTGESKRLMVTIGQFSTIRLERDAQLQLPELSYCIPQKACCDDPGCAEDPCELFGKIDFPTEAFFPSGQGQGPSPCVRFDEAADTCRR